MSTLNHIHFRAIIPIYNLEAEKFIMEGAVREVNYTFSLDYIDLTLLSNASSLFQYIGPNYTSTIYDYIVQSPQKTAGRYCPFFVLDIIQPATPDLDVAMNSEELCYFTNALIDTLSLTTTKSINTDRTFDIRITDVLYNGNVRAPYDGIGWTERGMRPFSEYHGSLGRSGFDFNYKEKLKGLYELLIEFCYSSDSTYKKIFNLGLSYYQTARCLDRIDHSFLLLAIVIEIVFKTDEREDFDKAAKRCRVFLSIQSNQWTNSFKEIREIRNSIAHGELLDMHTLKSKYDELFTVVRHSLIELLLRKNELESLDQCQWFST